MKICNNHVYTWGNGISYGELGKFHFIKDISDINIIPELVSFYDKYIQATTIYGLKYSAFAYIYGNKDFFAWGRNDNNQCYYKNTFSYNTMPYSSYFNKVTNIKNNHIIDNYYKKTLWNEYIDSK